MDSWFKMCTKGGQKFSTVCRQNLQEPVLNHDTENILKTCHRPRYQHNSITRHQIFFVGQLFWGCVLQVRVTAVADTNSQTDLIWGCHALINVNQWSMT